MLHQPEFWVACAMVLFVILVAKPAFKGATKALDERANKISSDLDDAERLRNEAQDLLSQYQRKQRDAAGEAAGIIEHAKQEAERMDREGRERIKAAMERREQLAMDRISMAEQQAIERVRTRAVEVAIAASASVLSQSFGDDKANALIDDTIKHLPERLH